jgi:hypothetical protein
MSAPDITRGREKKERKGEKKRRERRSGGMK